jgi:transposase
MAAIPLREDYDGAQLRALAKASKDAGQVRSLLALASIYDGGSRGDAAKLGGVGVQTIRDWVVWFNAEGPSGLIDSHAPGPATILSDEHRRELARLVDEGPIPAVHGVVRWRLVDLAAWLFAEHAITISIQTMSDEMRAMGYRRLSARPRHHAQNEHALAAFKKTSPSAWRKSCRRTRASR